MYVDLVESRKLTVTEFFENPEIKQAMNKAPIAMQVRYCMVQDLHIIFS